MFAGAAPHTEYAAGKETTVSQFDHGRLGMSYDPCGSIPEIRLIPITAALACLVGRCGYQCHLRPDCPAMSPMS